MKRKLQTITALVLIAVLALSLGHPPSAKAYKHPGGLWQYFDEWSKALEQKDYNTILKLAPAIEALYSGEPLNMDNSSLLSILCENAARGNELNGNLPAAVEWIKKQLVYDNYINSQGKDYKDRIILAEALLRTLEVQPDIYTVASSPANHPYFGSVAEPQTGTIFGSVAGRPEVQDAGIIRGGESGALIYVEFEPYSEHNMQYWVEYFADCEKGRDALEGRAVIELAWNFPREGAQLAEIASGSNDSYIIESIKYLATLDTEILLRVGAEMNVWTHAADPDLFKTVFKKISNYARQYSSNIALVFSPNDISEWGMKYKDYYPGDEYVDWIGSSTYFTNSDSRGRDYLTDAFYHAGVYSSDPTARIRELVQTFPNKPIMISECGFAYYSKTYGDRTADAVDRLNKFYSTVTMRYPQVKAIFYFDTVIKGGEYSYNFYGSPALKNAYLEVTAGETFLSRSDGTAKSYTKLANVNEKMDTLKLYTDALFPSTSPTSVVYTLDGKVIATAAKPPFESAIPVKDLALGTHKVRADITCGNIKMTIERQFNVLAGGIIAGENAPKLSALPTVSKVYVDGTLTGFDAYNISDNNYFKLRDIAYVLNGSAKQFSVGWDGAVNMILLKSGESYTPVGGEMAAKGSGTKTPVPTSSAIMLNGSPAAITAYNIENNNYFKIRDLGQALNFNVTWDGSAIHITTTEDYTG